MDWLVDTPFEMTLPLVMFDFDQHIISYKKISCRKFDQDVLFLTSTKAKTRSHGRHHDHDALSLDVILTDFCRFVGRHRKRNDAGRTFCINEEHEWNEMEVLSQDRSHKIVMFFIEVRRSVRSAYCGSEHFPSGQFLRILRHVWAPEQQQSMLHVDVARSVCQQADRNDQWHQQPNSNHTPSHKMVCVELICLGFWWKSTHSTFWCLRLNSVSCSVCWIRDEAFDLQLLWCKCSFEMRLSRHGVLGVSVVDQDDEFQSTLVQEDRTHIPLTGRHADWQDGLMERHYEWDTSSLKILMRGRAGWRWQCAYKRRTQRWQGTLWNHKRLFFKVLWNVFTYGWTRKTFSDGASDLFSWTRTAPQIFCRL